MSACNETLDFDHGLSALQTDLICMSYRPYRPVARIFYGWVRSVDYTDQRAPEALFTRGVRGHAPPGNFEN